MAVDPRELEQHRGWLRRLAVLQLHDDARADDVVQDVLTAALTARHDGRSSLKTWLGGILKHKVVDLIRRESRFVTLATDDNDEIPDNAWDELFDTHHHWSQAPLSWRAPDEALTDRQFQQTFENCCQRMPRKHAQVFMMREVMDMEIDEICKQLDVSATNCSVILYRARMSLRLCLEQRWFGAGGSR